MQRSEKPTQDSALEPGPPPDNVRVTGTLFDKVLSLLGRKHLTAGAPATNSTWRSMQPILCAVLLSLVLVTVPSVPVNSPADISLGAVLNYAHQHRLQFGTEIFCTYGPLGFLIFPCFSHYTGATRLLVEFSLCLIISTGLCLLAWRLHPFRRIVLLVVFTWACSNVDPRMDVMIEAGFLTWGMLCLVESGRRLRWCILTLGAFAVLTALAKTSFLFLAAFTVILLACDLSARSQRRLALGLLVGFGAAFLLGWILLGQGLSHLGLFLLNALTIVQSYNQSLGLEGLPRLRQAGTLLLMLLLGFVFLRTLTAFEPADKYCRWRRGLVLIWVSILTFANWKHSFVRMDGWHAVWFLAFAPLVASALEVLPSCSSTKPLVSTLGLVCLVLAVTLQQWFFIPAEYKSVAQPFHQIRYNLRSLLNPSAYERRMGGILDELRTKQQLPVSRQIIGKASVDVFGQLQAFALDNDLNYRPRPAFQSYAACSRRLMFLNEEFYLSPAAPEYVLFDLHPMDSKLPSLEDAWVLRHLLFNYELINIEEGLLLLKKKSAEPVSLTLLHEGTVGPGQSIPLNNYTNTHIWIEIDLKPTFLGWLRQFVHQPSTVRLAVWKEPGKGLIVRRRAPAAMLAAGFLFNPLLLGTTDMQNAYQGKPGTRPGACSVALVAGEEHFWRETIQFRVYKIEKRSNRQKSVAEAE